MLECWSYTAAKRPCFAHVKERLVEMDRADSPYVEFGASVAPLPPPDHPPAGPPFDRKLSLTASFHSAIVPSEII